MAQIRRLNLHNQKEHTGASAQYSPSSETSARHFRLLTTIHQVLHSVSSDMEFERELLSLIPRISSTFLFSTISIGILDGDALVFHTDHCTNPSSHRLPIARGLCGRVARTGIGELVNDVRSDPDVAMVDADVVSQACVPIRVDGMIWGVLNVEAGADITLEAGEFDALERVASSIGSMIERSRQRRSEAYRLRQLSHLQRIAGRIAGRVDDGGDQHPEDILVEISRVFGYIGTGLGIVRDGRLDVYLAYVDFLTGNPPSETVTMTGIAGSVMRTGEPAFSHDIRGRADTTQQICVPIRTGSTIVGVLIVEANPARQLDESDMDILLTLGDHFGTAISNNLRIAELERRTRQLRLVDRVAALIAGQTAIGDALPLILAEFEDAFGYGSSGIGLIDGQRLVFAAVHDVNEASIRDYFLDHGISIDIGITGRVARTGQPAFIKDVSASSDYLPTSPAVRYEICVPIPANGRTIGVLNVETPSSRPLDDSDFEIITTIANHLGMAFARGEAHEAERRSQTTIEAVRVVSSMVASALDEHTALRRIVETVANAHDYPYVSLSLVEANELRAIAWRDLPEGQFPPRITVGSGVPGRAATLNRPDMAFQIDPGDRSAMARSDATSQIAIPIHAAGELAGVLIVEGSESRPLAPDDLQHLRPIAEHAGVAISKARQFEHVQRCALRDPVTGLPNCRQFLTRFRSEIERAERLRQPCSLLLIDIESFTTIVDAFGPLAGDDVLRELGSRLTAGLPSAVIIARYIGDGFAALLPQTSGPVAGHIAERLSVAAASQPVRLSSGPNVAVTLSIGVGAYPDDASTADDLIDVVERRLYRSRRPESYGR